jgi:hypothetical protein
MILITALMEKTSHALLEQSEEVPLLVKSVLKDVEPVLLDNHVEHLLLWLAQTVTCALDLYLVPEVTPLSLEVGSLVVLLLLYV